jgi:hypothetical protein
MENNTRIFWPLWYKISKERDIELYLLDKWTMPLAEL